MNSTTDINVRSSKKSLPMILKEQPQLYDLHAHLLGMGHAGFWVDTILMDELIMPKHETFKNDEYTRKALCRLVWDKNTGGFVNGEETARFFHYLVTENIFKKTNDENREVLDFEQGIELLKEQNFSEVLTELIDKKLYGDLIHGGLEFKDDFSYDVVLELSDLGKGLGIKHSDCEGFIQLAVIEKLGCHLPDRRTTFQHWIIFNARKQKFEVVFGIQVDSLRELIKVDQNKPNEAAKMARAHIINAFSMCDAEGTRARSVDLHSFHGSFTPDFYPRRFALKDSIYSQRLDILAALIAHIIERYQTCLPPVKYCELSVSVNDISKEWVLDVLRSVRIYDQEAILRSKAKPESLIYTADDELSSFSQFVLNDHFPYLEAAFRRPELNEGKQVNSSLPNVMYKFLAGFDRQKIKAPFPVNPNQALDALYMTPHEQILLMLREIDKSKSNASEEEDNGEEKAFDPCLKQLESLKIASEIPWFHKWVVGLDLFGDELGYPYCPFVARPFIEFVLSQREKNKYFGVRIHCGENVKFATDDNPAYRLFVAHMYIIFRCLLFLQQELKYGIRIGHGIAFDHILGADLNSSKYRKSSVLMAEMRHNAYYLFKKIAFEVNITSNEYLLGQMLRQGDYSQVLRLKELFDMKANITLGTDDDGIWPIDHCSSVHPGHQSLAAEYCRALSTSLINSQENLQRTFETAKKFCFWDIQDKMQESFITAANSDGSPYMNTLIVHPDIIRLLYNIYVPPLEINRILKKYEIYSENTDERNPIIWTNMENKLRVTFVCIGSSEKHEEEDLREEYYKLFGDSTRSIGEFNFIYRYWQGIVCNFVQCKSHTEPEIKLPRNLNGKIYDVIRSVHPESKDPFKFLEGISWFETQNYIRAFATHIDSQRTIDSFNERPIPDKDTLYMYTNTKKYAFVYSNRGAGFPCRVNPTPSRRGKEEENFLYVLCEHASAATAALNLMSEELLQYSDEQLLRYSDEQLLEYGGHVPMSSSSIPPGDARPSHEPITEGQPRTSSTPLSPMEQMVHSNSDTNEPKQ